MNPATLVLATRDPAFAGVCEHLLAGSPVIELLVTVSTVELLEVTRQHEPDLVLLDVDGQDPAAMKALASKLSIVSDARIVLASAYLAPGSPGLCSLLQSIAASPLHKPQGASSLSLADTDGEAFVSALLSAAHAHAAGGSR